MSGGEQEGFIVEFVTLGNSVKVTAIDPASMREVSIVGSPRATNRQLAGLAIRKLKYVLERDCS
jgi:hypothetical protein